MPHVSFFFGVALLSLNTYFLVQDPSRRYNGVAAGMCIITLLSQVGH